MTAFLCIGTPAIAVFDPETVDTEKMLTRTETIVSYQYDDDFIRSVIDNEYLDLYNQNNDLFYVAEFDTFAEHREQFFHEMQKGTAFTFQGEYIDGDFRIYSIRDENGIDYYTIEDANTVVKEDKQKSLWFFTLLSVLFILGDVIYLMILRRLEKMPLWILKKVLKEDEPFPELRQKIPADHKAERKFVDQYFLKAATKKRRRKKQ
ncbi:MAG: hypothetical protein IIY02_04205 [Firmicutes bacterium]|nr:hypothetical protein [Bacillota bacterium]